MIPVSFAGVHCGAQGDWRNSLIPDKWPPPPVRKQFQTTFGRIKTVSVSNACKKHDDCYDSKDAERRQCDQQFLDNMQSECDRVYRTLAEVVVREACHMAATGYYEAVRNYGEEAFQNAQKKRKGSPAEVAVAQHNKGNEMNRGTFSPPVSPLPDGNDNVSHIAGTLLFANSDFELGDLSNWSAVGEAFRYQPVKGDNVSARGRGQASKHQGAYWIGTYEKYRGRSGEKPGDRQGDKPTGSLRSIPFTIKGQKIGFLIGGGRHSQKISVSLIVEKHKVRQASGSNSESMKKVFWNVSDFVGKDAYIEIQDSSSSGWGHINVDDFRYL